MCVCVPVCALMTHLDGQLCLMLKSRKVSRSLAQVRVKILCKKKKKQCYATCFLFSHAERFCCAARPRLLLLYNKFHIWDVWKKTKLAKQQDTWRLIEEGFLDSSLKLQDSLWQKKNHSSDDITPANANLIVFFFFFLNTAPCHDSSPGRSGAL